MLSPIRSGSRLCAQAATFCEDWLPLELHVWPRQKLGVPRSGPSSQFLRQRLEPRILMDAAVDVPFAPDIIEPSIQLDVAENRVAEQTQRTELLVVDPAVADADKLVQQLLAQRTNVRFEVQHLDADQNGLQQLAQLTAERNDLDAIHIVAHGTSAQMQLGNYRVTLDSLGDADNSLGTAPAASDQLAWRTVGNALAADGDLLLYGCDIGEAESGQRFVQQLSQLTGADVAASDDLTGGNASSGEDAGRSADWQLELRHGVIETTTLSAADYAGTLSLQIDAAANEAAVQSAFRTEFLGQGIISEQMTMIGSHDQFGVFVNDDSGVGRSILPVERGIVMVTGDVTTAAGQGNTSDNQGFKGGISTHSTANAGDTDLAKVASNNIIRDAAGYVFDFTPTTDRIAFVFSFASDEYPEFVGTPFNDAFGFFINGGEYTETTNLATVDGAGIAVNTINHGVAGSAGSGKIDFISTNQHLYIHNSIVEGNPAADQHDSQLEYDGLTTLLRVEAPVTRGTQYNMKIAIGDAGDGDWDSAVFFRQQGFLALSHASDNQYQTTNLQPVQGNVITDDTGQNTDVTPQGDQVGLRISAINGQAVNADILTGQSILLPSGATLTIAEQGQFTYDPSTSDSLGNQTSATDSFTYQITDAAGETDTATVTISLSQNLDTDGDGVPDSVDIDSDNDGILDRLENPTGDVDTDGDGVPNHLDLDSDNDGISDLRESGSKLVSLDIDHNGTISLEEASSPATPPPDADQDGLLTPFDQDLNSPDAKASAGTSPINTDEDALPDFLDLDSDQDGIPDTVESRPTTGYRANDGDVTDDDTDGDGVISLFDPDQSTGTPTFGAQFAPPPDTDGDGQVDYLDTDSDQDGRTDRQEAGDGLDPASYADPDGSTDQPQDLPNQFGDTSEVAYREQGSWSLTGVANVLEGEDARYVLRLDGVFGRGESATVDLRLNDIDTNIYDYDSLTSTLAQAVEQYQGPGRLTVSGNTLTFTGTRAGDRMAPLEIDLAICIDEWSEGPELYQLQLANSNVGLGNGLVTTQIDPNPSQDAVAWAIAGTEQVNEGQQAVYQVTMAGRLGEGESAAVQLQLADLTTSPDDYSSFTAAVQQAIEPHDSLSFDTETGQLTFVAPSDGATLPTIELRLDVIPDGLPEGPEQLRVQLANPTGSPGITSMLSMANAVTTTLDDAVATPALWSIGGPGQAAEGQDAVYRVQLDRPLQPGQQASVRLTLQDIDTNSADYGQLQTALTTAVTSSSGFTYAAQTQTLTFTAAADQTTADLEFALPLIADSVVEPTEAYQLLLTEPNGGQGVTVGVSQAAGRVTTAIVGTPVAEPDSYQTPAGTVVTGNLLANDLEPNGGPLKLTNINGISVGTQPISTPNGTITVSDNGDFSYTPNDRFRGTDRFEYEVCDSFGNCVIGQVEVAIADVAITKRQVDVQAVGDQFQVTFEIQVENVGSTDVADVRVFDQPHLDFGNRLSSVSAPTLTSDSRPELSSSISSSWTLDSAGPLLDAQDISTPLAPGERFTITYSVMLDPDRGGSSSYLTTQARVEAVEVNTRQAVEDLSDSGTQTRTQNADSLDDTGTEDDPTSVLVPDIGLAKQVLDVELDGDHFHVTTELVIENTGTTTLQDIQLYDDLDAQLRPHQVRFMDGPNIVADTSGSLIAAAQFGDDVTQSLLHPGGTLQPGDSARVRFTYAIYPAAGAELLGDTALFNQAIAQATPLANNGQVLLGNDGSALLARDLSDSGGSPNTNNPGAPGDTGGYSDPTPIDLLTYRKDAIHDFAVDNHQSELPESTPRPLTPDTAVVPDLALEIKKPDISLARLHQEHLRPLGDWNQAMHTGGNDLRLSVKHIFDDRGYEFHPDPEVGSAANPVPMSDVLTLYLSKPVGGSELDN